MNWKQFFLNLGGVAAGGFATVVTTNGGGAGLTKATIITAIIAPVLANLIGLFQPSPKPQL